MPASCELQACHRHPSMPSSSLLPLSFKHDVAISKRDAIVRPLWQRIAVESDPWLEAIAALGDRLDDVALPAKSLQVRVRPDAALVDASLDVVQLDGERDAADGETDLAEWVGQQVRSAHPLVSRRR